MELPIVLPVMALLLLWTGLGLLFALIYPWMSSAMHGMRADLRSIFQLGYALLPLMIAATTAVLVFTPFLGGVYLSSHCHDLSCASHVPVLQTGPVGGKLISASLFGIIFITIGLFMLSAWKNNRAVTALQRLSRADISDSFSVLETRDILALSVGTFRPCVLISRGMLDRASPEQLRVIVGHELAHGYRLDNLRRFIASFVSCTWPQQQRSQLLNDIELASEQSCDRDIALIIDNQAMVIETIQQVTLWRGHEDNSCCSTRIQSLSMPEDIQVDGWKPAAIMLTGGIVFSLLTGEILHRAAENFLSVVIY